MMDGYADAHQPKHSLQDNRAFFEAVHCSLYDDIDCDSKVRRLHQQLDEEFVWLPTTHELGQMVRHIMSGSAAESVPTSKTPRELKMNNVMNETSSDFLLERRFAINGKSCASCARRIEKQLENLSGVHHSGVNFASCRAAVDCNPAQNRIQDLIAEIKRTGYEAAGT
jgi:copper chaperone CopZ